MPTRAPVRRCSPTPSRSSGVLAADLLAPFALWTALPPSDYYGASAPPPGHQSATDLPAPPAWRAGHGRPGVVIAVGTALAGGPPHRSQRALLTHWAPASGQTCSRASGKGCTTRAGGSHRVARRFIRTQPIRVR